MPIPVFIIGWGRSGTTWISNLLIEHPRITGIHHEKHWGIHESAYFSEVVGRYGNLDIPVNFVEFVQVISASDYFRLAGVDARFLYALYPTTYAEVFQKVMNHYAIQSQATHWVEKTPLHTLHAKTIAGHYPDARFIAMIRQVSPVVASRMRLLERHGPQKRGVNRAITRWFWIAAWVVIWQHYQNEIDNLVEAHPDRALKIRFETLVTDSESVMKKICKFLDLEFETAMLKSPYAVNSSFINESNAARKRTLTSLEKHWLNIWKVLARIIPKKILSQAYKSGAYLFNRQRKELPPWFFKLLPEIPASLSEKLSAFHMKKG